MSSQIVLPAAQGGRMSGLPAVNRNMTTNLYEADRRSDTRAREDELQQPDELDTTTHGTPIPRGKGALNNR